MSPTVDSEVAKVKKGEFKWKIVDGDTKIVFKGEFKPGHRAKGTFFYRFTEADDECSTDGPLPWKAERNV